jgi:hypothetical protein
MIVPEYGQMLGAPFESKAGPQVLFSSRSTMPQACRKVTKQI